MGIKNLHTLLRKLCPQVYNTVPLTKYAFKKIAIDLSLFMCKYKTSFGPNWLDAFLQMISVLRFNDIHFVVVYDNKAPPEKDDERKQRSEARAKSRQKVDLLQEAWDQLQQSLGPDVDFDRTQIPDDNILSAFVNRLPTVMDDDRVKKAKIEEELHRLRQSLLSIRSEDFELTKELFKICGIPCLLAEGEAEATCAALNRQGFVSAVATDDTDVLAYGAPIMLSKIDLVSNTCIEIDYQEVLHELNLSSQEFLDLCILCGTDYNKNLPKIGCDRSYKLIQQHKSIENLKKAQPHLPFEELNHHRVRELFLQPLEFQEDVSFCDFPNEKLLTEFCFRHNCRYDVRLVIRSCTTSQFHEFELEKAEEKQEEKNKNNLLLVNKRNETK